VHRRHQVTGRDQHRLPAGRRVRLARYPEGRLSVRLVVAEAERVAELAGSAAGLRIRELTGLAEFEAACRLFDEVWQPDPASRPMTAELLRALTKAGSYAAGAYRGELLVGASVAFFGPPAEATLHSHVTGVHDAGRGTGYALKLHQRAWALRRGVTEIAWTYDPLVRRNAYFNLVKLGARAAEYLPNFYGGMHDAINRDGDTDRLLVRWDLRSPDVADACAGKISAASATAEQARGAVTVLSAAADGRPLLTAAPVGSAALVAVPPDIEGMRTTDPAGASAWRAALRDALAPAMAAGARITGFDRDGWYVMATTQEDSS
jgi:predicted GNAT superfamily acetyltransferase